MTEKRMTYRQFKTSYADCETVPGSYNKSSKTIIVLIPEGRMKKSGVRGQSFRYIWFNGIRKTDGSTARICIKATCIENAIKRLPDDCIWEV